MKLIRYQYQSQTYLGIWQDAEVYPLPCRDLHELFAGSSLISAAGTPVPYTSVGLLAPMAHPLQDIIGIGLNYRDHAEESARFKNIPFSLPKHPVYFGKRVNSFVAPGEALPLPQPTQAFDYEAELAVIIGKEAYQVSEKNAMDYVFGYTILNDVTARDLQNKHQQWYIGKSLSARCPLGPCVVLKEALPDPHDLSIRCFVNDDLRQNSRTSELIFKIPELIAELSTCFPLKAGSIIATGTPGGVGGGYIPPKYLQKGDTITCQIAQIGTLENTIV